MNVLNYAITFLKKKMNCREKASYLCISNTKMEKVMRARHHCYRFGAGFSLPSSATLIIKLTHSIFLLIFFSIPLQFRDRGLSFISNRTCLDEENYGWRNGCIFFQFPKGKQKRKGKEKETCSRTSTNNLALITRTHFHLSREYQLLTYSLDFFQTKIGSKRLVVLYPPVGGGRGGWTTKMATMVIIDATNRKIAARKAALQNLRP